MNRKWAEFFAIGYGMEVENDLAYGKIKDYEVNATVQPLQRIPPIEIHISCYTTAAQKRKIKAAIMNSSLAFFSVAFDKFGLSLGFKAPANRLRRSLPDVLDRIFTVLIENGALNSEYCPVCGTPFEAETPSKSYVDGMYITIDSACAKTVKTAVAEPNTATAPNNYFRGFLGALIGGLVGVGLSVFFYSVGFITSLSAIVSTLLGSFLYKKFHGKRNKIMIVIVSLTTLVLTVSTVPCIYLSVAAIEASKIVGDLSTIDAFNILMDEVEFSAPFYRDLGLAFLFSAIGIMIVTTLFMQETKRKKRNGKQ